MLNGDKEPLPPVEAVPDIIASPPDPKKPKLSPSEADSEQHDPTPVQEVSASSANTDSSPGAGPSTLPEKENGVKVDKEVDGEMSFSVQPPTPEATAVSLPVVEKLEEEWTTCHMVWRGTTYEFAVEANDL